SYPERNPPCMVLGVTEPRLRADALANRARILSAARDTFVELGPSAPLEEISRRAGTGIATLYRRFPDRQALLPAILEELPQHDEELERLRTEGSRLLDELVAAAHDAGTLRAEVTSGDI